MHFSKSSEQGFTLIEILTVVAIMGVMMAVSIPMSFSMYGSYKASIKAQEVMAFISSLRRDSFLYSEGKVLSTDNDAITVDGKGKDFPGIRLRIDLPIVFYRNGTTSGGIIHIYIGNQAYSLRVKAPLGDMFLTRTGSA
jgi:prepilin-type N-terminal cleavage/methylation domain-containing protein